MFGLDYIASVEHDVRQRIIYPEAERRERLARELKAHPEARSRVTRRAGRTRRLLGGGLVGAGSLLRGLGERVAARPTDAGSFSY